MTSPHKQQVAGSFKGLDVSPETDKLKISLNKRLALYGECCQIQGTQTEVEMDAEGNWSTELVDTDNMESGTFYRFEINGRVYEKLVPVAAHCLEFNQLPDWVC